MICMVDKIMNPFGYYTDPYSKKKWFKNPTDRIDDDDDDENGVEFVGW